MNKHIKAYLTVVGIKMVEKMIVSTATKLSDKSGMKVEDIKEDLTTGFKVKGEKDIFFDIKSMVTHLGNKKINVEDITMVVLRQIDERMENNKLRRVDSSEIKGKFKLDLQALTEESKQLLSKISILPSSVKNEESEESNIVSSTFKPDKENEEEEQIEITIDENINTILGEENVVSVSLEELGEHVTEEDVPEVKETITEETDKQSFVSKANDASKRTIGKVVGEISDYKDIVDNLKRGSKIKIIAERCNLNRDYTMEGSEVDGNIVPLNNRYSQQKNLQEEDKILELVHIYQGRKYVNTIGKTQLLDFLKMASTNGKIIIEEIKTINTIKNEFEPKKSWA